MDCIPARRASPVPARSVPVDDRMRTSLRPEPSPARPAHLDRVRATRTRERRPGRGPAVLPGSRRERARLTVAPPHGPRDGRGDALRARSVLIGTFEGEPKPSNIRRTSQRSIGAGSHASPTPSSSESTKPPESPGHGSQSSGIPSMSSSRIVIGMHGARSAGTPSGGTYGCSRRNSTSHAGVTQATSPKPHAGSTHEGRTIWDHLDGCGAAVSSFDAIDSIGWDVSSRSCSRSPAAISCTASTRPG